MADMDKKLVSFEVLKDVKDDLDESIVSLQSDIATKIDKPQTAPTVGQTLKVLSVNDDGTFLCGWADGGSGGSTDVQINGTSITQDGIANIPYSTTTEFGLVKIRQGCGLIQSANNAGLSLDPAGTASINSRATYRPLASNQLNYAVKAALSDSKRIGYNGDTGLSSDQMANACAVIGSMRKIRHIATLTKTSELGAFTNDKVFSLSADENGNPFSLSYVIIHTHSPAKSAEDSSADNGYFRFNDINDLFGAYALKGKAEHNYNTFQFFADRGRPYALLCFTCLNGNIAGVANVVRNYGSTQTMTNTPVTKISWQGNGNITEGTTFDIWGMDS